MRSTAVISSHCSREEDRKDTFIARAGNSVELAIGVGNLDAEKRAVASVAAPFRSLPDTGRQGKRTLRVNLREDRQALAGEDRWRKKRRLNFYVAAAAGPCRTH
jgi:hypothetical protein